MPCYIIFYHYPLVVCLLEKESRESTFGWEWRNGGPERCRGRTSHNQDILCDKISSNKRGKKDVSIAILKLSMSS